MSPPLAAPPQNLRDFDRDASIVLVGCRGAGKRTLLFIGAMHLHRQLVIMDHYFEKTTGLSCADFIGQHGRDAFTQRNAEVFRQMLATHSRRCIIECGMTSLTEDAQDALRAYGKTHPVIYVHREREQMLRYLDLSDADQLLEADQSHRECSNFEYYNLYDLYRGRLPATGGTGESIASSSGGNSPLDPTQHHNTYGFIGSTTSNLGSLPSLALSGPSSRLVHAKEDFAQFLDLLQESPWPKKWAESPFSINALPLEFRASSFALRLRLSYLVDMDTDWEDFEAHGDCVELIIDHWPDDVLNIIARQVALIRRKLAVPIIYHVEENPREERNRPLDERDRMDTELLDLGLRLNVEYVSLDLQRSDDLVRHVLARRGRSRIIGNFFYPGLAAPPWTSPTLVQNYKRARDLNCDVVRFTLFWSGGNSSDGPQKFRAKIAETVPDPKPRLVAHEYSLLGVRLPLQIPIMSPVRHPDVPNQRDHLATVASLSSTHRMHFRTGAIPQLHFYTIGSHIAYSITPAINTAAFEFLSMRHTFQAAACNTIEDLRNLFLSTSSLGNEAFGGATLAAPYKVAIRPYLKLESQHAAALGAVNVILPLRGQSDSVFEHVQARSQSGACSQFYGDNTDWSSIYRCLQRALSPRNAVQRPRSTGLVIGAGGMARAAIYALIRLGCRHIFVYNRTTEHARDVAEHFNNLANSLHHAAASPPNGVSHVSAVSSSASSPAATTTASRICHVLSSKSDPWPSEFQPPTMVISCVPAVNTDGSTAANFEMPSQWLTSPTGGVVVEVNSLPHFHFCHFSPVFDPYFVLTWQYGN